MSALVAVDAGRTTCRAVRFDGTTRRGEDTRPTGRTVADPGGPAAVLKTIRETTGWLAGGPVEAVVAGFAGLASRPGAGRELTDGLAAQFPRARVRCVADLVTAHAGALAGTPGVVLLAGTGAGALAVDGTGRQARVDGWGHLLGDAGGGFAVGRAGLDAALRHHDGRGGSAELARRARRRFDDLDGLAARLHRSVDAVRTVAGFAVDVAAAARAGDATAERIWQDAATELADTAAAAARRAFGEKPVRVSWAGGLFAAGRMLLTPLRRALATAHPAARLVSPAGDALDGAARLARAPRSCPHLLTSSPAATTAAVRAKEHR